MNIPPNEKGPAVGSEAKGKPNAAQTYRPVGTIVKPEGVELLDDYDARLADEVEFWQAIEAEWSQVSNEPLPSNIIPNVFFYAEGGGR